LNKFLPLYGLFITFSIWPFYSLDLATLTIASLGGGGKGGHQLTETGATALNFM